MITGLYHTHSLLVTLFLIQYLVKTILLLANQKDMLASYVKRTRIPEMVVSAGFLITGIWMLTTLGYFNWMLWAKLALVFASIPLAVIGFKKASKPLAVLSFVFLVGAYGLAEMFSKAKLAPQNIESSQAIKESLEAAGDDVDLVEAGQKIYANYCVQCHGEDGAMGANGAKNLADSRLSDEDLKMILAKGKNLMPAYEGILSDREREALAEYVKTIRK